MSDGRSPKSTDQAISSTAAISIAADISLSSSKPSTLTTPGQPTSSWTQQEIVETREILQAFWIKCLVEKKQDNVDGFKNYIKSEYFKNDTEGQGKIEKIFTDATTNPHNGFDLFCAEIQKFPLRLIHEMNMALKLIPRKETHEISRRVENADIDNLIEYMHEEKISAAVSLRSDAGNLVTPMTTEGRSPYAIHSVGKVFTGMLALRMIQEGVISDPQKPLDEDFLKQLPAAIQSYLIENKITLHQLMTHRAGLGDYLGNYVGAIAKALDAGQDPPKINQPEDLLKYADDERFKIGEVKYSNLGILLVGLAIKTAYEKQYGSYDYDEILRRYVIDDANISSFSSKMPKDGKYNAKDRIAPHIAGGPGGGYWTNAEDLAKFGKWIYEKCKVDEQDTSTRPKLGDLIEKYGQEFCPHDAQHIEHGGTLPTSSAFFSVSLKTGSVIAVLSDQPRVASHLHEKIQENMCSSPANSMHNASSSSQIINDESNDKTPGLTR